jgi:predicted Rossmann-fold nucleotide-binding protein
VAGYWAPLGALLDHAVAERFLRPEHRAGLLSADDPDALLDALAAWQPVNVGKWMDVPPPP